MVIRTYLHASFNGSIGVDRDYRDGCSSSWVAPVPDESPCGENAVRPVRGRVRQSPILASLFPFSCCSPSPPRRRSPLTSRASRPTRCAPTPTAPTPATTMRSPTTTAKRPAALPMSPTAAASPSSPPRPQLAAPTIRAPLSAS